MAKRNIFKISLVILLFTASGCWRGAATNKIVITTALQDGAQLIVTCNVKYKTNSQADAAATITAISDFIASYVRDNQQAPTVGTVSELQVSYDGNSLSVSDIATLSISNELINPVPANPKDSAEPID